MCACIVVWCLLCGCALSCVALRWPCCNADAWGVNPVCIGLDIVCPGRVWCECFLGRSSRVGCRLCRATVAPLALCVLMSQNIMLDLQQQYGRLHACMMKHVWSVRSSCLQQQQQQHGSKYGRSLWNGHTFLCVCMPACLRTPMTCVCRCWRATGARQQVLYHHHIYIRAYVGAIRWLYWLLPTACQQSSCSSPEPLVGCLLACSCVCGVVWHSIAPGD